MTNWPHRRDCRLGIALALCCLAGCVERRMIITSEPYSAVVFDEKNLSIGAAPVDRTFVYYGKYRFRLVKDGYETLVVEENVAAPWFEWPGLDFFSENLLPFTIRDVRHFNYKLKPLQVVPPEQILNEGTAQRDRARTIGVPLPEASKPRVLPPGVAPVPPGVPPQPVPEGPPPQVLPPQGPPPQALPVPSAPPVP